MKNKNKDLISETKTLLSEISEILNKSGVQTEEKLGKALPMSASNPMAEMTKEDEEMDMDQADLQDDQMMDQGEEGAESEDEGEEEMEDFDMSSMSDEELQQLIEMLQEELMSRQGGSDMEADMGKTMDMEKSEDKEEMKKEYDEMKKEYGEMKKSMEAMQRKISKLEKSQVSSKPVSFNKKSAEVMEKSDKIGAQKKAPRLSKSETMDYLQNQLRGGNRSITTDVVWHLTRINENDHEALNNYHEQLFKQGIQIPGMS